MSRSTWRTCSFADPISALLGKRSLSNPFVSLLKLQGCDLSVLRRRRRPPVPVIAIAFCKCRTLSHTRETVSAESVRPPAWLVAPVNVLKRRFPRLNGAIWNAQ